MELKLIRFANLPPKVNGVTVIDDNGDYNIYINQDICPKKIKKAIQHELKHTINNDFFNHKNIEHIEINVEFSKELDLLEFL